MVSRTAIGAPDSTATFTVDGEAGRDYLMGGPEADSLGSRHRSGRARMTAGADTAHRRRRAPTQSASRLRAFDPDRDDGAISMSLGEQAQDDGGAVPERAGRQQHRGTRASSDESSSSRDNVLQDRERQAPNVLVGTGTVRGLGGRRRPHQRRPARRRRDARRRRQRSTGSKRFARGTPCQRRLRRQRQRASPAGQATTSSSRTLRRHANCERVNVGMHVLGARIDRPATDGWRSARASTAPTRAGACCASSRCTRRGHEASIERTDHE